MISIEGILLGIFMAGIIYFLYKAKQDKKLADVLSINKAEREAVRKAQEDLERGIEEARKRYLEKRKAYLEEKAKFISKPPPPSLTIIENKGNKDDENN